ASLTIASGTTLTTIGTLTFANSSTAGFAVNTGTIAAQGNITIGNSLSYNGSATVLINGAGNQTFTGNDTTSAGGFPNVNINKPSGTLTLAGTINTYKDW